MKEINRVFPKGCVNRKDILIFVFFNIALFQLSSCTNNTRSSDEMVRARKSIEANDNDELVFYLTLPESSSFPIALICEGSSLENDLSSVWSLHDHPQMKSFQQLPVGVLSIEKRGIDGNTINNEEFFAKYTRSQRFKDHVDVINHLQKNPPRGFNGKLIFIGASEGGPLVNQLSAYFPGTIATINWSGAGDWPWPKELWAWFKQMKEKYGVLASLYAWWKNLPRNQEEFDKLLAQISKNPSDEEFFLGMTYRYHADAMSVSPIDYEAIKAPMLIVCGTKDSLINSCDDFVGKAEAVNAPITFWRVEGMEHRISQNKHNLIPKSFEWLKQWL